jgi:hypothetical protein
MFTSDELSNFQWRTGYKYSSGLVSALPRRCDLLKRSPDHGPPTFGSDETVAGNTSCVGTGT